MSELKIEYVELSTLKPYENNAKIHTEEQIAQICESIVQFGMNDPIAVWHDNEIIEGHGRLLACKRLGMKTVPVIRLDDLTDEERRAYMNAHNQLTMNTGFDIELLNAELAKIENIDMSKFGFDVNMTADDDEVEEDDYIEPEDLPARTRMGDMYRLGDHILMCGDSTTDDVQKLCGGGYSRSMCDGSSIQRISGERSRADNQERQHGGKRVLKVLDFRVPTDRKGTPTGCRVLYLVRQPERGDLRTQPERGDLTV